jgi:hypothetical protein
MRMPCAGRIGEHVLNQRLQRLVVCLCLRRRELLDSLPSARAPDTRRFPIYPQARGDLLGVGTIGGQEDGPYPADHALRAGCTASQVFQDGPLSGCQADGWWVWAGQKVLLLCTEVWMTAVSVCRCHYKPSEDFCRAVLAISFVAFSRNEL